MKYLDKNSLFKTIDNVSEALLFDLKIEDNEKIEIADFIVSQQDQPHVYADTFAPTNIDLKSDYILFTGERIKTSAGKRHMIGEEACRILRKLKLQTDKVKIALQRADIGLQKRIHESIQKSGYNSGMYCCKSCSCALWINLASGGLNHNTELLNAGLTTLKNYRDDTGKWKGFPYYYTLYVLNEMDTELVLDELRYAAKTIEKRLKTKMTDDTKHKLRRNFIYEQVLEKVNCNL